MLRIVLKDARLYGFALKVHRGIPRLEMRTGNQAKPPVSYLRHVEGLSLFFGFNVLIKTNNTNVNRRPS